jgi:hypothetical protein
LAALLLSYWATSGGAQGFGPDPFQPYNSQYAPFIYPVAPGATDYGYNNGPIGGVRGANQFQNYLNALQGLATSGQRGGAGTPYFRANRAYDTQFDRIYRPNKAADERFESNQEMATDLYFKFLREKDPRRRSDIFREYTQARNRVDRDLLPSRGTAPRSAARASRREGRSTTAAGSGNRDRNLPDAPPPLSSDRVRPRAGDRTRPGTAGSTSESPDGPPPPLGGSTSSVGSTREATPSEILDRATRIERPRVGPRPRGTGPVPPRAPSP